VPDVFRPLTLLLGGAALWALCLLVLALGGLGTRFPEPALDSPPPPLPKVALVATRSRLGPPDSYAEVGSRPVMNEGRQPSVVAESAEGASNADLDVTLSSVLITSNLKLALLTDNKDNSSKRVKLGDVVEGSNWRLVSLEPRQAVMEGPTGQKVLPLRVYDGASGENPTAVASTDAAQQGGVNPPPRSPPPPPVAQNAPPTATVSKPDPNQMSQEQQVEAIRARIEARRAQMRAEAEAAAAAVHQK
jgi:general secretion pathway protein N